MYSFHRILADYSPLVEFYTLDAIYDGGTNDIVRLTVLVHPFTSQDLIRRMGSDLRACMSETEIVEICEDFDLPLGSGEGHLWSPIIMRSAAPL